MADRIQRYTDGHQSSRGLGEQGDTYNHDGISTHDLIELGLAEPLIGARDVLAKAVGRVPGSSVKASGIGSCAETPAIPMVATFVEQGPVEHPQVCSSQANRIDSDAGPERVEPTGYEGWSGDLSGPEDLEDQGWQSHEDSLDALWLEQVPEVVDEPIGTRAPQDGVSSSERAIQLALAFLQSEGISARPNLDFLVDIIQERGWTSVQFQVRGLISAGYDIAQVHRMFELTDAWQHCVDSDTLAPERWHGGKRLTWVEAAQLLDFLGYDADLEQISDFLALEREIWQELRRSSGQLATFKNYLFGYRLSPRTQVDDGIWQVNLDPGDTRSFDGTRNSLCHPGWWEEPVEGNAWTLQQILGACHDLGGLADWLAPEERGFFG